MQSATDEWSTLLARIDRTDLQIRILEEVLESLHDRIASDLDALDKHTRPTPNHANPILLEAIERSRARSNASKPSRLVYRDTETKCRYAKDAYVQVFKHILNDYPDQWHDAVTRLNSKCSTNLVIAPSREKLLPQYQPDQRRAQSEPIGGGWFISKVGLDMKAINRRLTMLCKSVALQFGKDVVLAEFD